MIRDRARAAAAVIGVVVVCLFVIVRCQPDGPAAVPLRTAPLSTATPSTTRPGLIATTTVPASPASTTEEARPAPAATVDAVSNADAARVAGLFVHAWVLRSDVDTRLAMLGKLTAAGYGDSVAWTDPDILPAGNTVTVDAVDIAGDLTATVAVTVDGIRLRVFEQKTGDGWRVVGHEEAR